MKKIASFQINHDTLKKGMYISRVDGDVVTYDIRMKLPNGGDYFDMASAHTLEHLLATFVRNGEKGSEVVYVGPMGCRTGFYVLLRDSVNESEAISLVQEGMAFIRDYEGEIPGATKAECGNYLEHNLSGAKALAKDMSEVLENWTVEKLKYED